MPTMGADTKCATYQAAGRLSGITNSGDGNLPDFSYDGYDLVGNLSDFTAGGDNYEYTYDEMNRLDTVSGAITRNYDYDRLGNIDQAIVNGVTRNYTYASGNPMRLMGVTDLPLTVDSTAGYDTWGNMRKYALGGVAYELTFNAENRLASVKVGAATPTTFSYDADGQRVQTNYPDGTIVYTPFPDYEVTDPPTGANTVRTTYRLAGQIVAVQTKVGTAGGTFYYTYTDHLGNITALSTTAGAYVTDSKARYDPFGGSTTEPTGSNPSISNNGFTGHRHNNTGANDLGLIYMNSRYYLPEVGRFISPDTIVPDPGNPQSYNRYAYANNNPLRHIDQSGHFPWDVIDVIFWGISVYEFAHQPSLANAAWVLLDTASLAPILPSVGYIRHGSRAISLYDEIVQFSTRYGDEALDFSRIAHKKGAINLLRKFNTAGNNWRMIKGVKTELEYALKFSDEIVEIGRKLDGGAEIDFVLEGNVFVDVKNYDRTSTFYQEPQNIQLVINRFLDQVRRYQIYTDEIKYVFKGSVPDVIREAIEQAGVIVEVIP